MNSIIKKNIVLVYGGISLESNISIKSASNVLNNIDFEKFNIFILGLSNYYTFHINNITKCIKKIESFLIKNLRKKNNILKVSFDNKIYMSSKIIKKFVPDLFFPLIHGELGEDGLIQNIFNVFKTPYIGSNIKSSCLCLNKDLTKCLLEKNNFNVPKYIVFNKNNIKNINFKNIVKKIGNKFFIKPSNQGSSIGITFIKSNKNFNNAISRAFYFSNTIIIEEYIKGIEIECSVLNYNNKIISSDCGEIIKNGPFYSYNKKYNKKNTFLIPARINNNIKKKIKKYSIEIFKLFECKDIARIDFIVKNNKIFINEINTIPGLTSKSIYYKLFESYNINLKKIISSLISLYI